MKKLIFIGILFASMNANAQINFIQSSEDNYGVVDYNGDKYIAVNAENESIDFYNPDFSFSSSITISVPGGFEFYSYVYFTSNYFSKNLFDTDNDYEFPVFFTDTASGNYGHMIQIINEDGSVLKEFSNTNLGFGIHNINGESRLVIQRYENYPDQLVFDYYTLPGEYAGKANTQNEPILPPFPNPTGNTITIPYNIEKSETTTLNIYSNSGKLVEAKKIGGAFNQIKLNVSDYQEGMYFYQYDGGRGTFVVN